jgi:glycosyltransferase involved in cell wall biosynthesis|tara:strand:- start:4763 stop:5695 length:933 start_codon:yes stop_codon:yes gene_type:complete
MSEVKVFLNSPHEDWIVDRLIDEWRDGNSQISTHDIISSNLVWIISPWAIKSLSKKELKKRKVFCTIHHLDEEKFNFLEKRKFKNLDRLVDHYHVISDQTENSLKKLTKKPIWNNPWWIDQNKWFKIENKTLLRQELRVSKDNFLIGSFQRDTEGSDLKSPKLSKGPDRLIEIILEYKKKYKNLQVILSGKRRQYVINKLKENNINYLYFEMADVESLNKLYNSLDLYIVSSRVEGGPQAIYECAMAQVPIISTDVGVANKFLDKSSIYEMENFQKAQPNVKIAYNKIQSQKIPIGFNPFIEKLREIVES